MFGKGFDNGIGQQDFENNVHFNKHLPVSKTKEEIASEIREAGLNQHVLPSVKTEKRVNNCCLFWGAGKAHG